MGLNRGMKLLVVHPGASFSTNDVCVGLKEGLRERGHEIYDYALDARIEMSGRWLTFCWKRGGKMLERPQPPDILYHAGEELVARALRVMPDWVLVVSGMFLHPDVFVLLKRARLKVALLLTESPYDDEQQERLLEWVAMAWTNERSSARKWGIPYLPHAYRASVHRPAPPDPGLPTHDVVFVGTAFQERIDFLASVDWSGIDFGLYGAWETLPSRHALRRHLRGGYVDNDQAAALYRSARIGLNLYRTSKGFGRNTDKIDHAESLGPRAYELAATGCFHLSDHRAEVSEIFGDAVPTFRTAGELRGLVQYWLSHEDERKAAAARLPGLVAGHSWTERAAQIEADLHTAAAGHRFGIVAAAR